MIREKDAMLRYLPFIAMTIFIMCSDAAGMEAPKGKDFPVCRKYFFNYPHSMPPDYVFRTSRVFPPASGSGVVFNPVSEAIKQRSLSKEAEAGIPQDRGEMLREKVQDLVRQLLENAKEEINDEYVVTVNTFVNLNNLYRTSSLGRYMSEQLVTELQRVGVDVLEIRKTPSIMMSKGFGEYGLSRDMDELDFVHASHAMIVGTYSSADGRIFINARVLRNRDGMVLSTASLVFELDSVTWAMLADESMPAPVGPGSTVNVRVVQD